MTLTISPSSSPSPTRKATRLTTGVTSRTGPAGRRPKSASSARSACGLRINKPRLLGRYLEREDRLRQVVALPGAGESVLVVDRDATTLGDCRLVAHLAADEPWENAALLCRHYLRDPGGRWCRGVTPEDLEISPFAVAEEVDHQALARLNMSALTDRQGRTYRLDLGFPEISKSGKRNLEPRISTPHLRWHRSSPTAEGQRSEPVSMREVIACLESYEPVRTLTYSALALHRDDQGVSIATLRAERVRMDTSQIVLNRGLRRAALAATATQGLSMSEIAVRCGRVKRDARGKESGETSWLARRLGIAPESGQSSPTPWIHTDVLALIARAGLGISPREVEL
jgi:hypothetical protein